MPLEGCQGFLRTFFGGAIGGLRGALIDGISGPAAEVPHAVDCEEFRSAACYWPGTITSVLGTFENDVVQVLRLQLIRRAV